MRTQRIIKFQCVVCKRLFTFKEWQKCQCGGFIDTIYAKSDLKMISPSLYPALKWGNYLPFPQEFLLPTDVRETPLAEATKLAKQLKLKKLYLKVETTNDTKTFKDRMAEAVLSFLNYQGINEFVACSTGNASTALANAAAKYPTKFTAYIFCAEEFLYRLNVPDYPNVKVFSVKGVDFVRAAEVSQKFAAKYGLIYEGGFYDPARREGLKLLTLEAYAQMIERNWEQPDYLFQAVSSAMGIWGINKGISELSGLGYVKKIPGLVACQQDTCNPMVRAFKDNSPLITPKYIVQNPTGLAKAILRGNPSDTYPYIRKIVLKTGGSFVSVNDEEIITARKKLLEVEGVDTSYDASITLASLKKAIDEGWVKRDSIVMLNISGADRDQKIRPSRVRYLDFE